MATRSRESNRMKSKEKAPAAPRKKAAATQSTRSAKPTPPAAPEDSTPSGTKSGAKGLLHAGLNVAKQQANMIETLLGMGKAGDPASKSVAGRTFAPLDMGIRKFEDVFNQRVAQAMRHLGQPGAEEIQELREQVRLLQERVDLLERGEGSPRRKR